MRPLFPTRPRCDLSPFRSAFGLLLCAALLLFAAPRLGGAVGGEGARVVEQSVRRAALQCYALEGRYPPGVAYLKEHYGLRYDEDLYRVHYEIFASNLMPDITILQRGAPPPAAPEKGT